MVRYFLKGFLATIVILFLMATPVMATAQPDSAPSIESIFIYHHLQETDDMLIVAKYNIPYATPPDEPVNETFIFRLIDTDNVTELGTILAYPYNENGYGDGVISFYFSAAIAPTWGQPYIIRISGNPVNFAAPGEWNYTIATGDYTTLTTQDGNQTDLASRVITLAGELEISWNVTLLDETDTGTVLWSSGESYFRNAITGLQNMAPDAFSLQIIDVNYTPRDWDTTYSSNMTTQWTGTWVGNGLTSLGDLFSTDFQLQTGIIVLLICVAWIIFAGVMTGNINAGIMDALVIALGATLIGFLPMAMEATITMLCILYVGYELLFVRG